MRALIRIAVARRGVMGSLGHTAGGGGRKTPPPAGKNAGVRDDAAWAWNPQVYCTTGRLRNHLGRGRVRDKMEAPATDPRGLKRFQPPHIDSMKTLAACVLGILLSLAAVAQNPVGAAKPANRASIDGVVTKEPGS